MNSEARLFIRVRALVHDAISSRGCSVREVGRRLGQTSCAGIYRALGGVVTLRTLVHIADALDYDVVINFRDRRTEAHVLQGGQECHS